MRRRDFLKRMGQTGITAAAASNPVISRVASALEPSPKYDSGMKPIPGDLDNDGQVNQGDLDLMIANLNSADSRFDVNKDGTVNEGDLDLLVQYQGSQTVFQLNFNQPLYSDQPTLYFVGSLIKEQENLPARLANIVEMGNVKDISLQGIAENPYAPGHGARLVFPPSDVNRLYAFSQALPDEEVQAILQNSGLPGYFLEVMDRGKGSGIKTTFNYKPSKTHTEKAFLTLWAVSSGDQNARGYSPMTVSINGEEVVMEYSPQSRDGAGGEYVTWEISQHLKEGENVISVNAKEFYTHPWIKAIRLHTQPIEELTGMNWTVHYKPQK